MKLIVLVLCVLIGLGQCWDKGLPPSEVTCNILIACNSNSFPAKTICGLSENGCLGAHNFYNECDLGYYNCEHPSNVFYQYADVACEDIGKEVDEIVTLSPIETGGGEPVYCNDSPPVPVPIKPIISVPIRPVVPTSAVSQIDRIRLELGLLQQLILPKAIYTIQPVVPVPSVGCSETKVQTIQPVVRSETKVLTIQPVVRSETKVQTIQPVVRSETKVQSVKY